VPLIQYVPKNFSEVQEDLILKANRVIREYVQKGFSLTLRQLYYVFVGRKLFPEEWRYVRVGPDKWARSPEGTTNATPNYKALVKLISDARLAGEIDWLAIEDRTRSSYANQHWAKPSDMVEVALQAYAIDKWANQPHYVEVWVEKEALEQVLQTACRPLDVRFFACRGYTSQSAMWEAAQRLLSKQTAGKEVHVIHLGDHDPSGMDMSRDIKSKLQLFTGNSVHVLRAALNMAQVEAFGLPPDPAKSTDPRFRDYQERFGDESWELDALEPTILVDRITRAVLQYRDEDLWQQAVEEENKGLRTLQMLRDNFSDVVLFLRSLEAAEHP
jgi:hypothetical protein